MESSAAARLTWVEERRSRPNSAITLAASRVETPCTYISAMASITARQELARRVVRRVEQFVNSASGGEPAGNGDGGAGLAAGDRPELNADQLRAWQPIEQAMREGGFKAFLLYGVTGATTLADISRVLTGPASPAALLSVTMLVAGLGFEAEQLAQLDIGAHEADELLGGEPRIGQRQCASRRRTAQETLDLDTLALGSGTPKHPAEHREAGDLAHDDAVQRDRVGRQNELEKTAPQYRQ